MNSKLLGMKTFLQEKAQQASKSVSAFVEHEDTKMVVQKTRSAISTAADEAVELGRRAAKSEMGKDAATGAAIGAAVAVPIPIIGPIFGAVVGAGAGIAMGLKSGHSKESSRQGMPNQPNLSNIDLHKQLIDLDDLRQKGILTQEEFDVEKKKILGK